MIVYESAKFHPRFMVQLRGSVMPFCAAVALPCALLTTALKICTQAFEDEVWDTVGIDHNSHQVISAAFSGMSFLIGFLVVFRAQQAYSRFWEGCTAICTMQGEWFDVASALVAFCKCSPASPRDVTLFKHTLIRLISMMNACVLMELSSGFDENSNSTLLKTKRAFELDLIDAEGLDSESLLSINSTPHKVQLLFTWIQQLIVENANKQVFSVSAPILSRCFQELGNGMVSYRQAYKIANIPLPFPYVQATEMLLVSHWLLIPFLMCVWVTSPIWAGLLTFVQVAFFWSLNAIATELENPFGEDANDLPAQVMQEEFNAELLLLLRPSTGVTAHLSVKAAFNETCDVIGQKMSLGKPSCLGKKGVDLPRHKRRSSLEGNVINLAALQEKINILDAIDPDGAMDNGSEGSRRIAPSSSRNGSKERVLLQVSEADYGRPHLLTEDGEAGSLPIPSSDTCDGEHPGGNEVITTKRSRVGFDDDEEVPAGVQHIAKLKQEEKCIDARQLAATRQLVSGLACLPELVTVCEDLRDSLKALQPDIATEQLSCLQELVRLGRESAQAPYTARPPAVVTSPTVGSHHSPRRGHGNPDLALRSVAVQRAVPKILDGCSSLRTCSPRESRWSTTIMR